MNCDKSIKVLEKKYNKIIYKFLHNEKLDKIITTYIKNNEVYLYGGMAIDIFVKHASKGKEKLYNKYKLADFDLLTENFIEVANEIAKIIKENTGYKIQLITGMTGRTRKIFVDLNSTAIVDVTKIDKKIPYITIDGYKIADPNYSKIDQYQNLSFNLFSDYYRIEKVLIKLRLLEKYAPIENKTTKEPIKHIYKKKYEESISDLNVLYEIIWGGDLAYNYYYDIQEEPQEIWILSNEMYKSFIPYQGKLRGPNYRIFSLFDTLFYEVFGDIKILTRVGLLYYYYRLRYFYETDEYDKKIYKLLHDEKTFDMYVSGKFPKIYQTKIPVVTERLFTYNTEFL